MQDCQHVVFSSKNMFNGSDTQYFTTCLLCRIPLRKIDEELKMKTLHQYQTQHQTQHQIQHNDLFFETCLPHCCHYNCQTKKCDTERTYFTNPITGENFKFQRLPGRACPVRIPERSQCVRVFTHEEVSFFSRVVKRIEKNASVNTIFEESISDVEDEKE